MIPKIAARLRKRLLRRRGISPVLATVIIFGIIISGIMIAVVQVLPEIERMRARSTIESVESGFLELDAAILELVSEGSYGSTTSSGGASRRVSIHTPQGSIGFDSGTIFNLQLLDNANQPITLQNDTTSSITSIFLNEPLGAVDYQIDSNHKFVFAGKMRYMTGTNPDTQRDHIITSGSFSGSVVNDLRPTNLTLSRDQEGGTQHIQLDYRVRLVVSYQAGARPTLRFDVIVIKLIGSFERFYERVRTFNVRVIPTLKTPLYNSSVINALELNMWWSSGYGRPVNCEVWSSRSIPGLTVSSLQVEIRPVIFEVHIT